MIGMILGNELCHGRRKRGPYWRCYITVESNLVSVTKILPTRSGQQYNLLLKETEQASTSQRNLLYRDCSKRIVEQAECGPMKNTLTQEYRLYLCRAQARTMRER